MTNTLVIDTSYGSTVGIVGHEPIVETDSRTHVERLQANIARVTADAGLAPGDLDEIVVGVGPAPFTGLRAGIVTAKALAFATGARLVGRNILEPQAQWNAVRGTSDGAPAGTGIRHVLTLAVNDARRKQLYFELCECPPEDASSVVEGKDAADDVAVDDAAAGSDAFGAWPAPLIDMDIDYPDSIVARVNRAVAAYADAVHGEVVVDVIGHGTGRYASILSGIDHVRDLVEDSVLDQGKRGLAVFAAAAGSRASDMPVEPLYLRRPDAEVPQPLKHVLGHAGTTGAHR